MKNLVVLNTEKKSVANPLPKRKAMGNAQSSNRKLWWKLNFVIPETNAHSRWWDKDTKPFADDRDREQFIYSVITVITRNGQLDLRDYDFRLLYSRRETDSIVARIVAEKNGVIAAKVEPDGDGKDHAQAFRALKKDVEIKLDRILSEIPSGEEAAKVLEVGVGPSLRLSEPRTSAISPGAALSPEPSSPSPLFSNTLRKPVPVLIDAPPAYTSPDVKGAGPDDNGNKC